MARHARSPETGRYQGLAGQLFVRQALPEIVGRLVPTIRPVGKPQMLIEADRWDDAEWLGELLRATATELPTPKPRKLRWGTSAPREK